MSRLSKRLERIEHKASGEFSKEAKEMLVTVLARRDAIFWPWRTRESFRGEVRQLEVDYLSGKRGVSAKADGKEAWKSAHYTRNELIQRGLVTASHSGGQVTSLFLTPQGEADARGLVGLPGIIPKMLDRLREAIGFTWLGCRYVSESSFWDTNLVGNTSDWEWRTEAFLPLLTCGVVRAIADAWNIIYYTDFSCTDNPPTLPPIVTSAFTEEPGLHSLYIRAFNAERSALERLKNDSCGLVIPIPCTLDPWRHAFHEREAKAADNG